MAKDHDSVLEGLKEAQNAEKDNRDMAEEADLFLNKRDGQWEPKIAQAWRNRPRYTYDHCNPIVDSIMSEMEAVDFAINVQPAGGEASKEIANLRGGIVRNIENISNARYIYNAAARVMVGTGLAGWRITQEYRDSDSFQQDLMISEISNFKKRVWYDSNAVQRTMEDARKCWVLTSMTQKAYDKKWPKGSKLSVDRDQDGIAYTQKRSDEITIGECYTKKKEERTLAQMSNGAVYAMNDDFNQVLDDLGQRGVVMIDERKRDIFVVYHQLFDGGDFLSDYNKTVFEYIPVIPAYGNYGLLEDKVIYWGVVEKLMDAQRVLNYSESKKTAESALKPLEKVWMTKDQAESDDVIDTLESQNTNSDPMQFYDWVDGQPPPFRMPPTPIDQVLVETSQSSKQYLKEGSGLFSAMRGQGQANQSAESIKLLQRKGDSSNYKYFISMEIAIQHTCRILNKAIPKVYDTKQSMRIVGEDGSQEVVTLHDNVFDQQSGQVVELNDLSKGHYDITCSVGPAFRNQQQEIVSNIIEMGKINPQFINLSADILIKNMTGPESNKLVERVRSQMVQSGLIPEDQLTEEERQKLMQQQQAAQNQPPNPIEQANLAIAQAEMEKAQAGTQDILSKIQERQQKMEFKVQEMLMKHADNQENKQFERDQKMIELIMSQADQLKTQSETLKNLKDAMGVDTVVGPGNVKTYAQQVALVDKSQKQN